LQQLLLQTQHGLQQLLLALQASNRARQQGQQQQ
jgi:hypothetical protein